jgi:hypothetical protein
MSLDTCIQKVFLKNFCWCKDIKKVLTASPAGSFPKPNVGIPGTSHLEFVDLWDSRGQSHTVQKYVLKTEKLEVKKQANSPNP